MAFHWFVSNFPPLWWFLYSCSHMLYTLLTLTDVSTTVVYFLFMSEMENLGSPRNTSNTFFCGCFVYVCFLSLLHGSINHTFERFSLQYYATLIIYIDDNTCIYCILLCAIVLHLCPTGNSPDCAQVLLPFQHGQVHANTHTPISPPTVVVQAWFVDNVC